MQIESSDTKSELLINPISNPNEIQHLYPPVKLDQSTFLSYETIIDSEFKRYNEELEGHSGSVLVVELTSDDRYVISGSSDHLIIVWSLLTRKALFTLAGHSDSVTSLAVSSNSKLLISGSPDTKAIIWDLEQKFLRFTLQGHEKAVTSVDIQEVKELILTASADYLMKLWNFSGIILSTLSGHCQSIVTAKFLNNSNFIISGAEDKTIKLWDIESNSVVKSFKSHLDAITSIAISKDGKCFASSSNDKKIKIWSSEKDEQSQDQTLEIFEKFEILDSENIKMLVFSQDSSLLYSISDFYYIYLWDLHLRRRIHAVKLFPRSPTSIAISSDNSQLIIALREKNLKVWNSLEKREAVTLYGHSDEVTSIALSPDDKYLISSSLDSSVVLWNLRETREECKLASSSNRDFSVVYSIDLSTDNRFLISGHEDRNVRVWNMETRSLENSLSGHASNVLKVVFGPDSAFFASSSSTGEVIVWELLRRIQLVKIKAHEKITPALVFFGKDKLVTGANDRMIRVWDLQTGMKVKDLEGHSDFIWTLSISKDQRILLSGSRDSTIKIWDLKDFSELKTLTGHNRGINRLLLTADNKLIVSASSDKTIRIWSFEKKREEFRLESHSGEVESLKFLNNETQLVSCSYDQTIILWNFINKTIDHVFYGHSHWVRDIVVTNDSFWLVSCSEDKSIRVWSLGQKKDDISFCEPNGKVFCVSISKNCKFSLWGTENYTVQLFDFLDRKNYAVLKGHRGSVRAAEFSNNSLKIASGGDDQAIIIWNISGKKEEFRLQGHEASVKALVFSSNDKVLITGSCDKSIKLWNLSSKKNFETLNGHNGPVNSLKLDPSDSILFSCSDDKSIKVWNLTSKTQSYSLPVQIQEIKSVDVSFDQKFLVHTSYNVLKVWNLSSKTLEFSLSGHSRKQTNKVLVTSSFRSIISCSGDHSIKIFDIHYDSNRGKGERSNSSFEVKTVKQDNVVYRMQISQDGVTLYLSMYSGKTINIYNLKESKLVKRLAGHTSNVTEIILLESENLLISGSWDYTIKFWDLQRFKNSVTLKGHTHWVKCLAVSSNKTFLFSSGGDNTIKIWNIHERKEIFTLEGHKRDVNCLEVTKDDKLLISGSHDFSIKIWDLNSRRELRSLEGHTNWVWTVKLIQNEQLIASGSTDRTIKIWTFPQGREVLSLAGHTGEVQALLESPDQKYLISGAQGRAIKFWNLKERREEFSLNAHFNTVWCLGFSSDFKMLYSGSSDCTLKIWNLTAPSIRAFDAFDAGNGLTVTCSNNEYLALHDSTDSRTHDWLSSGNFDSCFQPLVAFYNVLDALSSSLYDNLSSESCTVTLGRFRITLLHFLCYSGKIGPVKKMLSSQCILRSDLFGRTAIFYALLKRHQNCVDEILQYLIILSESSEMHVFLTSCYATRNDFCSIIENTSIKLFPFLKTLTIFSPVSFASADISLPSMLSCSYFLPNRSDYETNLRPSTGEVPVFFKYSIFELPLMKGSRRCLELLEVIEKCSDSKIFKSEIIQNFIAFQWKSAKGWASLISLLLIMNLANLLALIDPNYSDSFYLLISYVLINSLLAFWETAQIVIFGISYFEDPWNYVDLVRLVTTSLWLIYRDTGFTYLAWIVVLTNFVRGLSAFSILDGTRYYVRLILRSIDFAKYFMIMFFYSTLAFGAMFVIINPEPINFDSLWMRSYGLNFGRYESGESSGYLQNMIYIVSTFINIVVMLNLLISVLGDSYDQFQIDKALIDYREKASISLEIQKMMFWARDKSELSYLHVMFSSNRDESEDTWEGKLSYIEKKIDSITQSVNEMNKVTSTQILMNIDSVKKEVEERIIGIKLAFTESNDNLKRIEEEQLNKFDSFQSFHNERFSEIRFKFENFQKNFLKVQEKVENIEKSSTSHFEVLTRVEDDLTKGHFFETMSKTKELLDINSKLIENLHTKNDENTQIIIKNQRTQADKLEKIEDIRFKTDQKLTEIEETFTKDIEKIEKLFELNQETLRRIENHQKINESQLSTLGVCQVGNQVKLKILEENQEFHRERLKIIELDQLSANEKFLNVENADKSTQDKLAELVSGQNFNDMKIMMIQKDLDQLEKKFEKSQNEIHLKLEKIIELLLK